MTGTTGGSCPGQNWADFIDEQLNTASVILLLVSANFLSSDYCYNREMERVLQREKAGEACVIPVILRDVDWKRAPFGHLQALPRDGKPVTKWQRRDDAFARHRSRRP